MNASFTHIGGNSNSKALVKWVIQKNGSLKVNGSTNINTFSCEVTGYIQPDTIICFNSTNDDAVVCMTGELRLNVLNFDCHNNMMTKDFRKTVKATDFPTLNIHFISLKKMPDLDRPVEVITGFVDIELAGVVKRCEVKYTFCVDDAHTISLVGTQVLSFSKFNLTPPKKFGGIIKAKDELDVNFHLTMQAIY